MQKFLDKKYTIGVILSLILVGAFFIRIYNFHDWLYFKMDQSRDATLISHAIEEGPAALPLLGPRAGATDVGGGFLRLGPAYYYFQYLSGSILNSTKPDVFAYPDLIFSLASILLLYFLARLYFFKNISLLISAMYAFSFLIIEYSRFAWNPNALQFFTLLTFFGLLKFLGEENQKKKKWWIIIFALGLAIGSQLHFFGFFVLTTISAILILFSNSLWKISKIKKIVQKKSLRSIFFHSLIFLVVFFAIYSPVIVSDVLTKGDNTKKFIQALSSKPTDKSPIEKLSKNFSENTKYYCLITTSFCGEGKPFKDNAFPATLSLIIILSGLFLAGRALRKEKDLGRRNFLALLFIWIGVFFIFTFPVSFQLRPRFFILVFAVPFLLSGIIFDFLREKWPKKSNILISIFFIAILASNTYGITKWFQEMKNSGIKDVEIDYTLILKTKDGVTLSQLEKAANFIYEQREEGQTIYFYVKAEHTSPIKYLLSQKNDSDLEYKSLSLNGDPKAQYFAIIPSHSNPKEKLEKKYKVPVEIISESQCGQINVYEITFPEREVSPEFKPSNKSSKSTRLFWSDVFKN